MNEYDCPQLIVCLTGETAETLYLSGEDECIVGISGFTSRPKETLKKPKVSTFTSAKPSEPLDPDVVRRGAAPREDAAREEIQT
jgi:iron complex transport system substrate-binding protein